jgi:hypothetical protein
MAVQREGWSCSTVELCAHVCVPLQRAQGDVQVLVPVQRDVTANLKLTRVVAVGAASILPANDRAILEGGAPAEAV